MKGFMKVMDNEGFSFLEDRTCRGVFLAFGYMNVVSFEKLKLLQLIWFSKNTIYIYI